MVGYESTSLGAVTVPALGDWLLCHILLSISQGTDPRLFKGYSAEELSPTGMNKRETNTEKCIRLGCSKRLM